jgi:hypothetical protein
VLENWKLSGIQPLVVKGPATKNELHAIVEKESRHLGGGVNVVVNEPTDILALLLCGKL